MSRTLGNQAEQLVADWLVQRGYEVLARNVVLQHGELDIVARQDREVVFVEVKARKGTWPPELAVTPAKQRTLVRTATLYMQARDLVDLPARFDVITVNLFDHTRPDIRHHTDAFRPDFSL
ncbi:MAG: YraN family protein [Bacteroidetes bacterium]|nr:YraN family protein [Bacteroidota bacterium]